MGYAQYGVTLTCTDPEVLDYLFLMNHFPSWVFSMERPFILSLNENMNAASVSILQGIMAQIIGGIN